MDSKLTFLFEQSNDFFCVLDKNANILHTNPAFRTVFGYDESELKTTGLDVLSHRADKKRRAQLLDNLAFYKEITGYESRIKAKNGCYYNVEWSVALNDEDDLVYARGTNVADKLAVANQNDITENIQHVIQSFNEGFLIIDHNRVITAYNPAFQAISGLTTEQLQNANFRQLYSLGITEKVMPQFEAAFTGNVSSHVQYFNSYYNRWLRVNVYPYKNEHTLFVRDITSIKMQQLVLALEKKVLELNATSANSLSQTITELLNGVEEIYPDMICSVLEIDEPQGKVYHLAAPHLPADYCMAIDGSTIGPRAGSCGTAAYHRSQVIVSDIETDPLWADYKQFALPHQLRACWSTPVISSNSAQVLATFAVYYNQKREPKSEELRMIERTTNILRVLIENKRNQDHVKDQTRRLQEIASISSHEIRRPVATILGLVNLFDRNILDNPMNKEIINHIDATAKELDEVIHTIVEKTVYLKGE